MTTLTREQRAGSRWSRLFAIRVHMESGFRLTPYNQHLAPEVRMRRWVGTQSKHFQIRYAELNRQLAQAERIMDEDIDDMYLTDIETFDRIFKEDI